MRDRRSRVLFACLTPMLVVCTLFCASGNADAMPPSETAEGLVRDGEVLETMSAAGYTYLRVKTEDGEIWAAGPQTVLAVGERVNLGAGALMPAFESKALERTFDEIFFVSAIEVVGRSDAAGSTAAMPAGHPSVKPTAAVAAGSLQKAEGGSTIAELFARRGELAGQKVLVRGKVVKFTANIMGRNWIHLQDGTGDADSNDLTVTTADAASIGDVVVVQGTAAVDKDFGAGYHYALIVEQASVQLE